MLPDLVVENAFVAVFADPAVQRGERPDVEHVTIINLHLYLVNLAAAMAHAAGASYTPMPGCAA